MEAALIPLSQTVVFGAKTPFGRTFPIFLVSFILSPDFPLRNERKKLLVGMQKPSLSVSPEVESGQKSHARHP
jgi:hypothetical protein